MNRKDRRAAQKTGNPAMSPMAQVLASAFRAHQAGHRSEAERLYRDVLAAEPRNGAALHLLGALLHQGGRTDEGISLIKQAVAVEPRNPDYHYNLGFILHASGRSHDAVAPLSKAIELKPRYAQAHFELGNALIHDNQLEAAEKSLRRAVELEPGNANALNNLGLALQRLNRIDDAVAMWERAAKLQPLPMSHMNIGIARKRQERFAEAEASLRRAVELKPGYPEATNLLAETLLIQGRAEEAFPLAIQAIEARETAETKTTFVQCLLALPEFKPDQALRDRLRRALSEAWSAPVGLAYATASILKAHPVLGTAIQRIETQWMPAYAAQQSPSVTDAEIAAAAREPLLRAYLEATQNLDPALERFLAALRADVLHRVTSGTAIPDAHLEFYAALAQQCFINEYVFNELNFELARLDQLIASVAKAIRDRQPPAPAELLALAAYRPLHAIEGAETLLQHTWPGFVANVLRQQITEPLREVALRDTTPALTPIDDGTSTTVQQQYEENPYPRWVNATSTVIPMSLDEMMEQQFPIADRPTLRPVSSPDILIAGCGTGSHPIFAAQSYRNANILAIDISRTSLAYARRRAEELGFGNIEFAQADILKLASLQRSFDVIESAGVLHHLSDPYAGWSVLVSLLRPGGLMRIGLYSELARRDVVAAREFARSGGYQSDPEGIRRCRQDIMRLPSGNAAVNLTNSVDFFSVSSFRDLVLHVQEHRMKLPDIRDFLSANNLDFIGFDVVDRVRRSFESRFPEPQMRKDLMAWHAFEQDNPYTFEGMYNFWVQKRA